MFRFLRHPFSRRGSRRNSQYAAEVAATEAAAAEDAVAEAEAEAEAEAAAAAEAAASAETAYNEQYDAPPAAESYECSISDLIHASRKQKKHGNINTEMLRRLVSLDSRVEEITQSMDNMNSEYSNLSARRSVYSHRDMLATSCSGTPWNELRRAVHRICTVETIEDIEALAEVAPDYTVIIHDREDCEENLQSLVTAAQSRGFVDILLYS